MSRMLNLADHLLSLGRKYQALGRDYDALHYLRRLANFRELPPDVSEETQSRLAEIFLRNGRSIRARRHLSALLVQCPDSARYHYLMATSLNGDEKADPHRALDHYRKSLELDASQPRCRGELGLLQLQLGDIDEGLDNLRQAAELAPDDPETVARLAEGLRQEGELDEARQMLRAALFRHPRDLRFRKLWNDFLFRELRLQQEESREPIDPAPVNGPRLLPFVRPAGVIPPAARGKVVRRDVPSAPQPPHAPAPSRLPGKKHA